jgi:hypothetical protein
MPRFVTTVWPGSVIPPPPVMRPASVRVHHGGWLELLGPATEVDVPTGFYLREMSAQRPTTIAGAAAFVEQWGRGSDPDARDLVGGEGSALLDLAPRPEGVLLPRDRRLADVRSDLASYLGRDYWSGRTGLVHAMEVIERGRLMSVFAEHAQAYEAGEDISAQAWEVFLESIDAALSAFQVRVLVEGEDRPFSLPDLTAYAVAALQLYNDMATGAAYRVCASETCDFVFTTQRGTAAYYQRTSGTKYCTNKCARAQAERQRRRRVKAGR